MSKQFYCSDGRGKNAVLDFIRENQGMCLHGLEELRPFGQIHQSILQPHLQVFCRRRTGRIKATSLCETANAGWGGAEGEEVNPQRVH